MIDRVEAGDRLSVVKQNLLIDQVNRLSEPIKRDVSPAMALFQLTSNFTYPDTDTAAADHFDQDPTPYTTARLVYLHKFKTLDDYRSYASMAAGKEIKVWHPATPRDVNGYGIPPAPFESGDKVFCRWNPQASRWEVIPVGSTSVSSYGQLYTAPTAGVSWTKAVFGNEEHSSSDVDPDAAAGTIEIGTDGVYRIQAHVTFGSGGADPAAMVAAIFLNGSGPYGPVAVGHTHVGVMGHISIDYFDELADGNTVSLYYDNFSGNSYWDGGSLTVEKL